MIEQIGRFEHGRDERTSLIGIERRRVRCRVVQVIWRWDV